MKKLFCFSQLVMFCILSVLAEGLAPDNRPLPEDSTKQGVWELTEDSVAFVNNDGAKVWQFNYNKQQTKPYFHPVALADGTVLTSASPEDHPWHYGLWFSWKYINGVNYWEEDWQTGRPGGLTRWDAVTVQKDPANTVVITMNLSYHPPQQPAVLTEHRTITITPLNEHGAYSMLWSCVFTAVADVVELDRTPVPGQPGGVLWGGYAGLSFRARPGAQNVRFTGKDGPVSLENGIFRGRGNAMAYSGVLDGRTYGVAIMDHPDNLRSPTPWYLIHNDQMDFFTPAVLCYEPYTLKQGQSLTLRYKVSIHPEILNSEKLLNIYSTVWK